MNIIKLIALFVATAIISATIGAGYVYNDAINSEAAHFHPTRLAIVWGPSNDIGISVDAAMPDVFLPPKKATQPAPKVGVK